AGGRVVLAAAEMLPPNSLDRVILLSPAVTCSYDLTRAMQASKCGILHFFSTNDDVLAVAEEGSKLADGLIGPAAGRVGFRPPCSDPREIATYNARLQQIRWTETWHGGGGHRVWLISHNLKKMSGPMFAPAPIYAPVPMFEPGPPPAIRNMPLA